MDCNLLILGIAGPELTPDEAARLRKLQPAGIILFTRNIVSAEQTRKLTDDLRGLYEDHDPIIAIDQEGGRVTRTKDIAPALPSAASLAAHNDPVAIAKAGAFTADLLRLLGINFNFAPDLDLDFHPDKQNALQGRCWGRNPQKVIDHAGTWNRWLRKRGVHSCGKHFPAGGRALSDPHHDLPQSDATLAQLLAEDVIPYTALMPELDAIMLAHVEFPNIDPARPASLSRRIIQGFLRDQLGFEKHVVLTDDLDMGAITKRYGRPDDARLAIEAGNDLALICHQLETAEAAAEAINTLPEWRLKESHKRVQRLRKKLVDPHKWSQAKWDETCKLIAEVTAAVPQQADASNSPVADY